MIEHKFSDLSQLTYRIFTIDRRVRHTVSLTILEWTGIYGHGSLGNDDAVYMRVITQAALSAWHSHGVIFDLRNLHYEWGNGIWAIFRVKDVPFATIISELCRPGFQTCMPIIEPAFTTLEPAVENVMGRAQIRLEALFAELDGQ